MPRKKLPNGTQKKRITIRLYPHQKAFLNENKISLTELIEQVLFEKYGVPTNWQAKKEEVPQS